MGSVGVVIAAAGSGRRMGGDKLFFRLEDGKTVLERSVLPFLLCEKIEKIVVATRTDIAETVKKLLPYPQVTVTVGGATRGQSVLNAVALIDTDFVLIHDGARPYVSKTLIEKVISQAESKGSAVPALPVAESLSEKGVPVNRANFLLSQTPQGFDTALLKQAFGHATTEFTDEAALFYAMHKKINYIEGEEANRKVTFPSDLRLSAGTGYDLHKLAEGRKLILGGVLIPHSKGLLGHSDADALAHAVMDALLSAAGLNDIGCFFPDSEPRYKDADSMLLLKEVVTMVNSKGYTVNNISAAIIAEAPKLQPYIRQMRTNLAAATGIEPEAVGISATTNETVGQIGQGLAIAVSAIATLIYRF